MARAENGLFPMADGPVQRGRGGTVIGIAEDTMSINSNPAALAFITGRRFDWNLASFWQPLKFSDAIQPKSVHGQRIPTVAPSFGYAFEYPKDIPGFLPGVWRSVFGPPAEVPTEEEPAGGEVAWGTEKLPRVLELAAGGVAARITRVKLYAYYRQGLPATPTVHVIDQQGLPPLPPGARVVGAGVDVRWRYRARMGENVSRLVFQVDGQRAEEALAGDGLEWRRQAASIVLDQPFPPRVVRCSIATGGNEVELAETNLRIGYELGGRFRWIKVSLDRPARAGTGIQAKEIGESEGPREIDTLVPRTVYRFRLDQKLPADARLLQIKARYDYDYSPSKSVANLMRVILVADGLEVAETAHSLTEKPQRLPEPPDDIRGSLPLPEKRRPWWKFGFGVFPQGGAGIEIDIKSDLFPDGLTNKSNLLFVSAAPSAAIRIGDHFAIGASFLANYAQMELDGFVEQPLDILKGQALSGISFSEVFRALTPFEGIRGAIDMQPADTYGWGAKFGVMARPHKTLSIGASYTTKSKNRDFETKAKVNFDPIFQVSGLSLILPALIFLPNGGLNGLSANYKMRVIDFQLPQVAGFGIAWRPVQLVRFSTDYKWVDWSDTMSQIKIKLSKGDNPDVNALTGGDTINAVFPVGWRDQHIIGGGTEFFMLGDKLVLRLGYNYGNSPVKRGFENPQIPALTKHHATAGMSWVGERVELHLGYSLGLRAQVEEKRGENKVSSDWNFSKTSFGPQNVLALGFSFKF